MSPHDPRPPGLLDRLSLTPGAVRFAAGVAVALAAALPWGATALGVFDLEAPEVVVEAKQAARPELMWLPGGTFQMGSPVGEAGRDNDENQHTVEVGPFAMCRTEVTQGQWEAVMGKNPSDCAFGCGAELPVQSVSWLDAMDFLNKLSEREGLSVCYTVSGEEVSWDQSCEGYRLPTEAEWEYAARGGTQTAWSWGDNEAGAEAHAWYSANSGGRVHAVGTKEPNPWGLYDVHGNVWEWVWDWYADTNVDTVVDKGGPPQGENRVLRGGSFDSDPSHLRSSNRVRVRPTYRNWYDGLRCARGSRPSIEP